jgi:adenosylhomocysteine nucleosidase
VVERVAVLAPMVSELKPVIRAFGLEPAPTPGDPKRFAGRVGAIDVVASMTGIGMVPAADATERVLAAEHPDFVIVVGIAGGVGDEVKVGDVFVPSVVVNGPTGSEHRPAELPGIVTRGRLVSSDDFHVEDDALVELEAAGVVALDMETGAIAAVCERDGTSWSVVRSISDMAKGHPIGEAAMTLAKPDGSPNMGAFLKYVSSNPGKLPALVKLGRDATVAAKRAAQAAARACAALD